MRKAERSFEYMSMRTNRQRTVHHPLGKATVRSTEIQFVHPRAPLGRSITAEDRYIRPLPGYTSEYEAEYRWPVQNRQRPERHPQFNLPPVIIPPNPDNYQAFDSSSAPRWNEILTICNALIALNFQVDKLTSLRRQIERRQLDAALEESLRDIKHRVEEQVVLHDMLKLDGWNDEVNRAVVNEEVLELLLKFVDSINEVKNA